MRVFILALCVFLLFWAGYLLAGNLARILRGRCCQGCKGCRQRDNCSAARRRR